MPSASVRAGSRSWPRRSGRTAPSAAIATMSASLKTAPAWWAPSAPADEPSRPTPATTPVTASHSRQDSETPITTQASTAMTARFAATMAWTANSGSRCSAISWARKPRVSMATLATKRHWCSSRGTRPGSTPVAARAGCWPRGRRSPASPRPRRRKRRDQGCGQAGQHGTHFSAAVIAGSASRQVRPGIPPAGAAAISAARWRGGPPSWSTAAGSPSGTRTGPTAG